MYDHAVRAASLTCLLAAACGDSTSKPDTFPGDEVTPRWLLEADGPSSGAGIALLPDGDLIVSILANTPIAPGPFTIAGETFDLETAGLVLLKLSAADGGILASSAIEGITLASFAVAEPGGDVFVSGVFVGEIDVGGGAVIAADDFGHLVARFSGDDLSHVWSRSLDVTANIAGFRLATTASGDLLAASEDTEELRVELLSGVDGETLWSSSPVDGDGEASDAAELPGGDVGAVGVLRNEAGVIEPVVVRVDGDSGAPVWQQTFEATGDGATMTEIEVVDGDLLVAGQTWGGTLSLGDTDITDRFKVFAARITPDGDLVWARDVCDFAACYGVWPLPMRLVGSTAVMDVFVGADADIAIQPIGLDGELGEPIILASSAQDYVGDAVADGDDLYLTGRTGVENDREDMVYGSVFILAL